MATMGSLQQILESQLPENQTLIESLSRSPIKTVNSIEQSSLTEIFGELHFKEKPETSVSSPTSLPLLSTSAPPAASLPDPDSQHKGNNNADNSKTTHETPSLDTILSTYRDEYAVRHKKNDSFSSMTSESLQFCTEGLGSESFDDVEDWKNESGNGWKKPEKETNSTNSTETEMNSTKHRRSASDGLSREFRRSRSIGRNFPPISCIGTSGKPFVRFRSFRHDGRFVLKEIRIPTQEFLHARRENGCLKLHFVQPDDNIPEEEEGDLEQAEQEETEGEYEEEKRSNGNE